MPEPPTRSVLDEIRLNAKPWPVRPKPLPSELLSSLVNRAAYANGLPAAHLHHGLIYDGGRCADDIDMRRWRRDFRETVPDPCWIDTRPRPEDIAQLSGRLCVDEQTLWDMSLAPEEDDGAFGEDYVRKMVLAYPDVVCPDFNDESGGFFGGFTKICTLCIAEDETPYFRREWRLKTADLCLTHSTELMTRCQKCDGAIRPHASCAHAPQHFCWKCGDDLRRQEVYRVPRCRRDQHRDVLFLLARVFTVMRFEDVRREACGGAIVKEVLRRMNRSIPMDGIEDFVHDTMVDLLNYRGP